MNCGQLLRNYRKTSGLSQRELAERVGVQRETVARWEIGERKVDTEKLSILSQITGIAPSELRPDLARLLEVAPSAA